MPLQVKELRALLDKMSDDAYVVINGEVVEGVVEKTGKHKQALAPGGAYYNDSFTISDKGRDKAVMFLHHSEGSDGQLGLFII